MVIKLIGVFLKPGHRDEFLAAQRVWNRETRAAPGYLGCLCSQEPNKPDVIYLQLFWRSRADLDDWMATDHDRIAALAGPDQHYDRLDVRILEGLLPGAGPPCGVLPEGTLEAAVIQTWSEFYRASAALRIAVRLALFDRLSGGYRTTDDLAREIGGAPGPLQHLLLALCAMGLLSREPGGWRTTSLADRTLVPGAPAYQGDMVLHNTQPEYLERVFSLGDRLGLPPDRADPGGFHAGFLRAMSNSAAAGQADALVASVDLTGCTTLLDVGGATGPYAIALCRAYPDLRVVILDRPETVPIAAPILASSGVGDRITIEAHDYRVSPFPGPVDVVLISNVLRGETPSATDDILRRAHAALTSGGRVLIVDLFPEGPPADPGLRAALFGLHVPDAANYSTSIMAQTVERAGFRIDRIERLRDTVVMNGLIDARRLD